MSLIDKSFGNIEDDLLKISMVDLESINGEPDDSSAKVTDLSN